MTPEEEAELAMLRARLRPDYAPPQAPPAPAVSDDGFLSRFAKGNVNTLTTGLVEDKIREGQGIGNLFVEDKQAPVELPKIFDMPEAATTSQRVADFGTGIIRNVAGALLPIGVISKGARLLGAAPKVASTIGNIGAGALSGIKNSPEDAAVTAGEFGAMDVINALPLPGGAGSKMLLRGALNAAVPFAGAAIRGQDPFTTNTGIQAGVQGLLGSHAPAALVKRLFGKAPTISEQPPKPETTAPNIDTPAGPEFDTKFMAEEAARVRDAQRGAPMFSDEPAVREEAPAPAQTRGAEPPGPLQDMARSVGVIHNGQWDSGIEAFTDPQSGSTFHLRANEVSPEAITQRLEAIRAPFTGSESMDAFSPEGQKQIDDMIASVQAEHAVKAPANEPAPAIKEPTPIFRAPEPEPVAPMLKARQEHIDKLRDQLSEIQAERDFERDEGNMDAVASLERTEGKFRKQIALLESGEAAPRQSSEAAFTDLEANPLTRFAPQISGALGGAALGAQNDPENRFRGAALGAAAGALVPGATRQLFKTLRNPAAAIASEQKLGVLPKSMRRLFPKTEEKLETAATDQTRLQHSPLGSALRFMEEKMNLGKSKETRRAEELGKGLTNELHGELTERARDLMKVAPTLTEPQKDVGRKFAESGGDAGDIAALDASATPVEYKEFLKAQKRAAIIASKEYQKAEPNPARRTMFSESRKEGYLTRAYDFIERPDKWKLDSQKLDAAVDFYANQPELKNASRTDIEFGIREGMEQMRAGKSFASGGGATKRIDQANYTKRKDLTPPQWKLLAGLDGDMRLTPPQRAAVKEIIATETVTPENQRVLGDMANKNGRLGDNERDMLREAAAREILPKEMRELMGEIKDPVDRLVYTNIKLLNNVHKAHALRQLAAMRFEDGTRGMYAPAAWERAMVAARASGDEALHAKLRGYMDVPDSPAFGFLAGKKAPREVIDSINAFNSGMASGWEGVMATGNSWLKEALTVMNPGTHSRQWLQTPLMGLMAGVYNPVWYGRAIGALRNSTKLAELRRLNIVGANFSHHDLKKLPKQLSGEKLGKLTNLRQFIRNIYGMPDDVTRVAAFLMKTEGEGATPIEALDHVNRYTQNYGAQNQLVNRAKHVPIVSPFISYQSEMLRVMKNLGEDFVTGTPKQRAHSVLAFGTLFAAPLAATMVARNALSKEDQRDWDKIDALAPEYQRSQLKVPLGRDKRGAFRYFNLSPVMPAGDYVTLLRNLQRGDWESMFSQQPFVGYRKSPVLSTLADLASEKNYVTQEPIKTPLQQAQRVSEALLPPLLGFEGKRFLSSITPNAEGGLGIENPRTGRRDTPADFVRGLFGLRTAGVQPKALFRAAKFEAAEQLRLANREAAMVTRTNVTPEAKASAQRRLFEKRKEIRETLRKKLAGAAP